jgi:peptidoglycan/xylan/chitin deacetylase (PgdA/CDA1 family)
MVFFFQKLAYRARIAAYKARFAVGLGRSLHRNRPRGRILIYHGIDTLGSTRFNSRFVPSDAFRHQVAYFAEHFHIVPLGRYLAGERAPDRLTLALTFDDGYRNNLELALPVLEEFNVPATFFVTTIRALGQDFLWPDWVDLGATFIQSPLKIGDRTYRKNRHGQLASDEGTLNRWLINHPSPQFIGLHEVLPSEEIRSTPEMEIYWRLLDQDDLRRLAASPLVTIGTHGLTHASFTALGRDRARDEMHRSKIWLEETTGHPVTALAFPFGHYSRENLDDAHDLGYRQLLAVDFAFSEDHSDDRIHARFGINPFIGWDLQLAAILKGTY